MPINAPLTLTTGDALRIASLAVQRYAETHRWYWRKWLRRRTEMKCT